MAIPWDTDYVTFRLEETDSTPLTEQSASWTRLYNGPAAAGDIAAAICRGDGDNVYVVGTSTGSLTGLDIKVIAYDGASSGADLFSTDADGRYDGGTGEDDWGLDVAHLTDAIFITGSTTVSADVMMITHSFDEWTGAARWASPELYNGGAGDDVGTKLAVDFKEISEPCFVKKPVVTGFTYDAMTDFNIRTIRYAECTSCSGPCP